MSEFYDDGRVNAAMVSREYREKPKNSFCEFPRMDAYNDWFDNREEAEAFLAETRSGGGGMRINYWHSEGRPEKNGSCESAGISITEAKRLLKMKSEKRVTATTDANTNSPCQRS
jgi:hypothetical protein